MKYVVTSFCYVSTCSLWGYDSGNILTCRCSSWRPWLATPGGVQFGAGLIPLHSQLLWKSRLVSFTPLINMFMVQRWPRLTG